MSAEETRTSLSAFLADAGMPADVSLYARRLEEAVLAGFQLADELRHFVSVAGSGDSAERVQSSLEIFDQAWAALATREQTLTA